MNKIKLLIIPSLLAVLLSGCSGKKSDKYHVDFFDNYLREEFTLSNGTVVKGNNVIFKTVDVEKDSLLEKPSEEPQRLRYEFQGWYKEKTCEKAWDFASERVTSNLRLYAKWGISHKDDTEEPPYTPPSTVLDDSAPNDYIIDSIMNFKLAGNTIGLPNSGLLKLEASKDDVLPLMEYRVKQGKTITATYAANSITVTCNGNVTNISVINKAAQYVVGNSTYDTKATNYENNAAEEGSYHVMLAGSSSIEFWDTSKQDLDPIVSYNHGIGGTTIEMWTSKLNQRLVYPYKPKMVVYYVGINNVINSKESASAINNKIDAFFEETHASLPNTQVQYVLMNQLPGYANYKTTINTVNEHIKQYQANNASWLTLINPGEALLKENGEPDAGYFRTDGLHLSYYGYVIWGGIIRDSIIEGLEKMK